MGSTLFANLLPFLSKKGEPNIQRKPWLKTTKFLVWPTVELILKKSIKPIPKKFSFS